MNVIDNEFRENILSHYTKDKHDLVNLQIDYLNEFVNKYYMNYKFSTNFRKATDLMMADILNGKLINIIKK